MDLNPDALLTGIVMSFVTAGMPIEEVCNLLESVAEELRRPSVRRAIQSFRADACSGVLMQPYLDMLHAPHLQVVRDPGETQVDEKQNTPEPAEVCDIGLAAAASVQALNPAERAILAKRMGIALPPQGPITPEMLDMGRKP